MSVLLNSVMVPPLLDMMSCWRRNKQHPDPLAALSQHRDHLLVVSQTSSGYRYDHYGRAFVDLFGQDLTGSIIENLPEEILPSVRRGILTSEYEVASRLAKPLWRAYSALFDDGSRQCWQRLVLPAADRRLIVGAYDAVPPQRLDTSSVEGLLRLVIERVPVVLSDDGLIEDLGVNLQAYGDAKIQVAELAVLASRDPLTGVSNLRHFRHVAGLELDHCSRMGRPFSLLALDIDHFKRINDTWGHAAGDEALKVFATQCQDALRGLDVLGRCGGEEFAVALPNTGLDGAFIIAERLRNRVQDIALPLANGDTLRFTVSIGVSVLEPGEEGLATISSLMQLADQALYRAKHQGRNRVIMAEPS